MRIATTLARIWRNQGHSSKARDLLAPICDWFGEFQLADIRDAKEVLNACASELRRLTVG